MDSHEKYILRHKISNKITQWPAFITNMNISFYHTSKNLDSYQKQFNKNVTLTLELQRYKSYVHILNFQHRMVRIFTVHSIMVTILIL
jgi:hypothetical protein